MAQRYVVSELAIVSWRNGEVHVTSPASGTSFTYRDPSRAAYSLQLYPVLGGEAEGTMMPPWLELTVSGTVPSREMSCSHGQPGVRITSRCRPAGRLCGVRRSNVARASARGSAG